QESGRDGAEMAGAPQQRQPDQAVEQGQGQEQGEVLAELGNQAQEIVIRHSTLTFRHSVAGRPRGSRRMVYAALSKGWRRPGKKLVNDRGESATNTATYSVELKVASQAVARSAGGRDLCLIRHGFGQWAAGARGTFR